MPPLVLHWVRRDLRLTDNAALNAAAASTGRVLCVYVTSGWRGQHRWTGSARQDLLCGSLASIAEDLGAIGGRLVFRNGPAEEAIPKLMAETGARAVYFSHDPDPFGRATEAKVARAVRDAGGEIHGARDASVHGGDEVLAASGSPYRVFTPYSRAWMKLPKPAVGGRPRRLDAPRDVLSEPAPALGRWGLRPGGIDLPEPGEKAARKRLADFLRGPVFRYGAKRDFPAEEATSRLSQDLRFGLVSAREVSARCIALIDRGDAGERESVAKFLAELVWREFYMQILWNYPEVLERDFSPDFGHVPWDDNAEALARWRDGTTGFPIVDAGMRQLRATGYVHNRVRMIVAMFLTKDLHLHWSLGEQWFMRSLADGEIASNNGGWQWSAGTGADAAPYFRIQNPWTQARRYDPDGEYVRRWVPELRDAPASDFFGPPVDGHPIARGYPPPMVNHAREREAALDRFKRPR